MDFLLIANFLCVRFFLAHFKTQIDRERLAPTVYLTVFHVVTVQMFE